MAVTTNRDTVIYEMTAQTAFLERIQDNLAFLNANSGGTIVARTQMMGGNFAKEAFYRIGNKIRDRDVHSTSLSPIKGIAMAERISVKHPWKYDPVSATIESFHRRDRNIGEFSVLVGQDIADAQLERVFQLATAPLIAAISAVPDVNVSGSLDTGAFEVLVKAKECFGDRADRIRMLVMNSSAYYKIVRHALDQKIDTDIGVVIRGGTPQTLGIPVLVTDLMPSDKILALQQGAIEIIESQPSILSTERVTNTENVQIYFTAEGTWNLSMLGYSYDVVLGENPTMATLSTSSAWKKHYLDVKSTAGVLINLT